MPIDFPDNPTLNQIFVATTGRSWEWDGTRWIAATMPNIESIVASGVSDGLAQIIDSAPTSLDTLNELAAALGDDANFASTVTIALGDINTSIDTVNTELDTKASTGKAIAMAIVFGG